MKRTGNAVTVHFSPGESGTPVGAQVAGAGRLPIVSTPEDQHLAQSLHGDRLPLRDFIRFQYRVPLVRDHQDSSCFDLAALISLL
jgi:hypothetical protein